MLPTRRHRSRPGWPTPARRTILLDVPVESAIQLFALVAHYIERSSGVSAERIRTELTKREQLGSTGLGRGVAIPACACRRSPLGVALFVRAQYPFSFNAPDRKPVREFIVLVLPQEDNRAHLELLADAARCFSERPFRQASRDALTPDEIHQLMRHALMPHPAAAGIHPFEFPCSQTLKVPPRRPAA